MNVCIFETFVFSFVVGRVEGETVADLGNHVQRRARRKPFQGARRPDKTANSREILFCKRLKLSKLGQD